ncbi:MAG: DUF1735 domain-containing protein, partial [Muribaculaceae bacterium]|nr:DUF1735 domain-containing protein [Muribaculaceae bacterium]
PDFEYQTVYFAQPSIGRTIELGEAFDVDLSLDSQHKFFVKAVRGGAYGNNADRIIHFKVDPTLCDNLYFTEDWGGHQTIVLPEDYYEIEDKDLIIPKGRIDGGITVRLTDKFFNDPKALDFNYVLPFVMTGVEGTDSILQGKKLVENPNRFIPTDWSVAPKDYVVYSLRFVNEWNGTYLRRGIDRITVDGTVSEVKRHKDFVERDEDVTISTSAYRSCDVSLSTQTDADHTYAYSLRLNFSEDGSCTVVSADENVTVSGSGKFLKKSEKQAISGVDRDGLYLDYTVTHPDGWSLAVADTLVMRDRNVSAMYPDLEIK